MFVETHAHLNLNQFDVDRDEVVQCAQENGIEKIINIGIDIPTSNESIRLAETYESVYAAVGMHPNDAVKAPLDYLKQVTTMLKHPKVVAIGEIGLDYYWDYTPADIQKRVLREQLELAIMADLPVIIHTRNAWPDILEILESDFANKLRGVFHCFSGDAEHAQRVLDLGYHISFTGVLTFKNSRAIDIAATIPAERLMLETDCPFMAPVPHRGKRCEPAYIPIIAETLAHARKINIEELAAQTTANARNLFHI
ncbi:TatD family hydrolase [candidate division KSB1 bacterium]|nr:TatD family hydrolase [candidate division KSB1 bacterium]